jgi:hypothetical protein
MASTQTPDKQTIRADEYQTKTNIYTTKWLHSTASNKIRKSTKYELDVYNGSVIRSDFSVRHLPG